MENVVSRVKLMMVKEETFPYSGIVDTPSAVVDIAINKLNMDKLPEEHMYLFCLDIRLQIIAVCHISHGSINMSITSIREIFKYAFMANSSSIVLTHNHPSGNPTPSQEDINLTKKLIEAGKLLNVEFLDHIIIGDTFKSLKAEGYFS